jgi:hypothetical protein
MKRINEQQSFGHQPDVGGQSVLLKRSTPINVHKQFDTMRPIIHFLASALLLASVHYTCQAAVVEGKTRARAEAELGIVIKRVSTGTQDAGISIELSRTNKLAGFRWVQLDIYFAPVPLGEQVRYPRRLASANLQPVEESKEKVRFFFSVDPQYLDRTAITFGVDRSVAGGPDGYMIWLDPKDFPSP